MLTKTFVNIYTGQSCGTELEPSLTLALERSVGINAAAVGTHAELSTLIVVDASRAIRGDMKS